MGIKKTPFVLLMLLILSVGIVPIVDQRNPLNFASAQIMPELPSFIELGFSPSSLSSVQEGIPVYSPGDSVWFLSTSNVIVSASLVSPSGITNGIHTVSTSTVSQLYTFSDTDTEGSWTLKLALRNSSTLSISIPFVNPSVHLIEPIMSGYSIEAGELNLGFKIPANDAFNVEDCLSSADVNSTVLVPIPESIGDGQMLVDGSLHSATLSVSGQTNQSFSFWYNMDYSYSFAGNLTGEFVSRDIAAISSTTALFTSSSTATVSLTNNTTPRPGRYELQAFFDSESGLFIEQTAALLLTNGHWLWIGGCNPYQISSLSFTQVASLVQGTRTWPTAMYLMYNIEGVDSYFVLQLNLNLASVDFLGSMDNATLPYLGFSIAPSPNILASGKYDGSLYLIAQNFPLSIQVTPTFGNESLQSQTVEISNPFTQDQIQIPVGRLDAIVTNDSAPLSGASLTVQNKYGGTTEVVTDSNGTAALYLPPGSYNVTASSGMSAISEAVTISSGEESGIQFAFSSSSSIGYIPDLLISLLVVGIALNIWLWMLRPKRAVY